MRFLAVRCHLCVQCFLVDAYRVIEGHNICPSCGRSALVLSGAASYGAHEIDLFQQIERALREAGVGPTNAAELRAGLGSLPDAGVGARLCWVIKALPTMASLEGLVSRKPRTLRSAERMLSTLLNAIATGRSQSGIFRTLKPGSERVVKLRG
jgi:hypothetical protein